LGSNGKPGSPSKRSSGVRKTSIARDATGTLVRVAPTTATPWTEHARETLSGSGHRASGARDEVIDAIDALGCSVTAREVSELLRRRNSPVGLASIYRAFELLERLGLVKRFDVGEGVARFEPAHPSGEHHHHVVCESCGTVEPFEDRGLERAIDRLSEKVGFDVAAHDVTLRGRCPACRTDLRPQTSDLRSS
jgi:Fur family transcriptional regulator, ferric uptake regulator